MKPIWHKNYYISENLDENKVYITFVLPRRQPYIVWDVPMGWDLNRIDKESCKETFLLYSKYLIIKELQNKIK